MSFQNGRKLAIAALTACLVAAMVPGQANAGAQPDGSRGKLSTVTAPAGDVSIQEWIPKCVGIWDQAPAWITHPSGVKLWWVFGDTFFYPGSGCANGKSALYMQEDGNFVLYDENGQWRWATHTVGRGAYAVFQRDGNLVVYTSSGGVAYASNTCCASNRGLAVQEDGNVVIYNLSWGAIWATHTNH